MNIRQVLEQRIMEALRVAGASVGALAQIRPAARPEFGDYQANGVMSAAKAIKRNPRELANTVVNAVDLTDVAQKVEIAGPGFINITLKNEMLCQALQQALTDAHLGVSSAESPQTIVVDYSHPNLAKEMHVGHLRSTIIGDAIVRVCEFLGHKVIRHNHVGDWGTQFGMLIAQMEQLSRERGVSSSMALADLEEFYRASKQHFDADPEFANIAREYVVKLQSGDEYCLNLWRQFTEESLRHCEAVYQRLNVTLKRADVKPESSYNDDLPRVIEDLRNAGLLKESEGAQCVFLEEFTGKDGAPLPVIIQKSDGGYLYATTDLAAIRYRANVLKADRVLYIVDARQSLHLQQVFAVSRRAGFLPERCSLEHHAFGTMLSKDGKPFKTRTGGTVKLIELLDEAEQRAFNLVTEKNPSLAESERRNIARIVGIGSIKYADLALSRTTDYVFDWDRMLSFQGNTAPYMQYAYARIRSIFRKGDIATPSAATMQIAEPAERQLALKLVQFAEIVETVAAECYPNVLCTYLYELAGLFMQFYESCPVLTADESIKASRLALCQLTGETIKLGLGLLGIETVERM
jgi:arginyl-tRNA synthetase